MRNLKFTIVIISILLISANLQAQKFYITAGGGYAFNMNAQKGWFANSKRERTRNTVTGNTSSTNTQEGVNFGLGKGVSFGGSVGYMFNDYLGLDLGFNYLYGAETNSEQSFHRKDIYSSGTEDYYDVSKNKLYARMFNVTPSILITPNFEKFNPYLKLGVVLGFGSLYWESNSESSSTGQVTPTYSTNSSILEYNGGLALGVNASVGAEYNLTENLGIFGELQLIGMNYSPKKMVTTKSTKNGVDQLPNMTTYEKETEFSKTITVTNAPRNDDKPRQDLLFSYPFSSIGFNIGVKYNF